MLYVLRTHLILSDFHIPDHNQELIRPLLNLIKDLQPEKLHILGDFINLTKASKYDPDPYYHVELSEEIEEGTRILTKLRKVMKGEILWFEGNHELRLIKFLARNALALAELNIEGERIVSIPHLFNLRELGVKYVGMFDNHREGDILFEHGSMVRIKSGYTAHAMIERRGMSGIMGHTHRLSLVTKTLSGRSMFWIENGCMCNLNPTPRYVNMPDWTNGFSIITFINDKVYPQVVPIINNSFSYGGKIYT